jgi:ferritin
MASQDSKRDNNSRLSSFNKEIEQGINDHIHRELQAYYNYTNLSTQCKNDSVALHGFAEYFCTVAKEAWADACSFMRYQTQRGGAVELRDIKAPRENWTSATESWRAALNIEKDLAEDLARLGQMASKYHDRAFTQWLEHHFLEKDVRHIKDTADILRQVERVEGIRPGRDSRESREETSAGQGLYELDREFRENGGLPRFNNRATEPQNLLREIENRQQQRGIGGTYYRGGKQPEVAEMMRLFNNL